MDLVTPILLIAVGLVTLLGGGELLVRGASALAAAARISPLVIGLTVVAFGTSAPELAVTAKAALAGETSLAVGNVVGSNIFNVLVVLGLSALVAPLVVSSRVIQLDVPLVIAASVAVFLMSLDGALGRVDGALLFGALVVYVVWSVRKSRQESAEVKEEFAEEFGAAAKRSAGALAWQLFLIVVGLALLALGSSWLVDGSVAIARHFRVSELVIGLTILAGGTSLPEVAASMVAAFRGERDIAVGNAIGSSLFNLLCVLGLASLLAPGGIDVAPAALWFDIPVMIVVAFACLPIFFTGHQIARWEGGLFFSYYLIYLADLVLRALEIDFADDFRLIIGVFVIPLTVVTLLIGVLRAWSRPQTAAPPA